MSGVKRMIFIAMVMKCWHNFLHLKNYFNMDVQQDDRSGEALGKNATESEERHS